jgi:hypothetical protein
MFFGHLPVAADQMRPRDCSTVDRRDGYYRNRKNGANRARTSASKGDSSVV